MAPTTDPRRRSTHRSVRTPGLYGSDTQAGGVTRAATAELIGTALLVLCGTAVAVGAIVGRPIAGQPADSLAIALAFGLALAALVAAFGHISGAHLNPAVTLGLAVTRKFPWSSVGPYVAAQLVGAVLGALCCWALFGEQGREAAHLAATYPSDGVGGLRALFTEALVTFLLVLVIISVATDDRVPAPVAPLAVGAALAAGVLIAGPITGGAVNPARALGPMLVAGDLSSCWLYVVGPIAGGVLAAITYDRFLASTSPPEVD